MKSLQKSLDILEYVVLQNGSCVTPSSAASALGFNVATCTRIMGTLVERGYLSQISRKSGYVPGPMLPSLCTRSNPYVLLSQASRGPISALSRALGVQVNLSVLHGASRIMLTFHLGDVQQKPWDHFHFSDQWDTATGRLLLAAAPETSPCLVGLSTDQRSLLAALRGEDHVCFQQNQLMIMGHSIRVPGYPVAAFGFGVPLERAEEALRLSQETATSITSSLTVPIQAY